MKFLIFLLSIFLSTSSNSYNLLETLQQESTQQRINSPWRLDYKPDGSECSFCSCVNGSDSKNFVIKKYKHNLLILNLYPYTTWGNFLIVPFKHTKSFKDLDDEAKLEIMQILEECQEVLLKEVDGLNIGINLGKYSGGSIPEHLHIHVVTRMSKAPGFLDITGELITLAVDLKEQQEKFKKLFCKQG